LITSFRVIDFSYTPTEEQLEQAKSWYAQMMDSADKGKAYDQAIMCYR
jgi:protease-3